MLQATARNHVDDPRGVYIDPRLIGLTVSKVSRGVRIWDRRDYATAALCRTCPRRPHSRQAEIRRLSAGLGSQRTAV